MVKHKRWSDNPKKKQPDPVIKEKTKLIEEKPTQKETTNFKSYLQSGSKVVYIIAAAALLSGIFTPLTIDADHEIVAYGIFSIILGLGGGVAIYTGITIEKFRSVIICGGLGMLIGSLILIHELAGRSIF